MNNAAVFFTFGTLVFGPGRSEGNPAERDAFLETAFFGNCFFWKLLFLETAFFGNCFLVLTSSTQKKIAADMRLASLLAFAFLGMLSTAACGGADGSGNTSADTVAVTISDSTLFAPRAAQAGSVVLQVRNIGSSPRSLHIADSTGRVDSLGQPLAADARGAMTLDLAPGVYEMYSPTSERDSTPGMDVQLTVGEGWGENALSSGSSLRGSLQRRQQ